MYFAWLETYTAWLVIPSIIGIIFGIVIYVDNPNDDSQDVMSGGEVVTLLYAILLSLGCTFMDQT